MPILQAARRTANPFGPSGQEHRIHHSAWKPETNSNYDDAVFPWWDLVFGTFRATARDGHERMRLGLDDVRGRAAHRPLWPLGSILSGSLRDRVKGD